jgi:tetratricopeptide (TPR) repeat protein
MRKAHTGKRADQTANDLKGRSLRNSSSDSSNSDSSKITSPNSPQSAAWSAFSGQARWVSLGLIAVNLIVYASVWHHEFVDYDDRAYVTENAVVSGGLTWHGVAWAFTTGDEANWHPLTWLSHMLDVQLYGLSPGPHHLTNLLFHIASTLLLFGLLHRMTGALGRSAFVAGLFAVHPLHVESVAWVAERKDVLSTLFWMLALWAYVEYVRRPQLLRYLLVLLFFALGLMAKPMLVTLPFVLLLLDFWPLGRVALGPNPEDRVPPRNGRSTPGHLVWEKIPLLALSIVSSVVTLIVQRRGRAVIGLDAIPLKLRVANALVSSVAYIGKMLWPTRLAVLYPYARSLPGWWVAGALVGLMGVSVAVIWAGRRHPYLPVGWLWYLGTLVPVIGLVQVGHQAMADRYTYVPLIGLFVIVAWGVPDLLVRCRLRRIALPAAGLVILGYAITARGQLQYWENSTALWTHALEVTTGNYIAHNNIGLILARQGRNDEAICEFLEVLWINPDYAEAHNSLGIILAGQGKLDEAIAHYSEALRIKPDYAEAYNNLGIALARLGRTGEAIDELSEALRINPDLVEAHNNLGIALATQGKLDEAIAHYTEALRIKPDYAEAHNNLGVALAREGRTGEAINELSEALRIKPDYQEARHSLEDLTSRKKRPERGTP